MSDGSSESWTCRTGLRHPTQDVFLRVFAALSPPAFSELFVTWTTYLRGRLKSVGGHVAIDGKTSRRSHNRSQERPAIHTVSAWLSDEGLVLGQWKTGTKSNEISAIPELLGRIDLRQRRSQPSPRSTRGTVVSKLGRSTLRECWTGSPPETDGRGSRLSRWSSASAPIWPPTRRPLRDAADATLLAAIRRPARSGLPRSFGGTGALRTNSTGFST